jgi:cyclopropane fatty-acyl-phospholipid synthase-like methyltransferase
VTKTSAKLWDAWNEQGGPKYPHEKVVQFCFRNFRPDQRSCVRALDVGCGSGVHVVFLASEGFQTTGIDISSVGISNVQQRLNALALKASLRIEGADRLDFPPRSFDLVLCVGVYDCTGPLIAKASVERLVPILTPGARGLFLFASDRDCRVTAENSLGLYGYTREEVEDLFDTGFSHVWVDRYITTYQGGQVEQNDWLVTLER